MLFLDLFITYKCHIILGLPVVHIPTQGVVDQGYAGLFDGYKPVHTIVFHDDILFFIIWYLDILSNRSPVIRSCDAEHFGCCWGPVTQQHLNSNIGICPIVDVVGKLILPGVSMVMSYIARYKTAPTGSPRRFVSYNPLSGFLTT